MLSDPRLTIIETDLHSSAPGSRFVRRIDGAWQAGKGGVFSLKPGGRRRALCLGLGLVEVIKRLVRLLDRAERALDPRVKPEGRLLPFERAVGRRPPFPGRRDVGADLMS